MKLNLSPTLAALALALLPALAPAQVVCIPSASRILQARCGATSTSPSDFEREVVQSYLSIHQIPLTDEPLVYQHGKFEMRNAIRATMFTRLIAIINSNSRTPGEQSIFNSFHTRVWDKEREMYASAVNDYRAWKTDPCKWKIDADVASQYGLNYDGSAWCTDRGLTAVLAYPQSAPTRDYFIAAAIKRVYGADYRDLNASRILSDTATRVSQAIGLSAGVGIGAVAAWVTVILTVAAVAKAIMPFASGGVATASAATGPVGIVLFALVIGITAGIQVTEAEKVQQDLAKLESMAANATNTSPDLRAFTKVPTGVFKLAQIFTAMTLPDFPSTATPPSNGPSDARFLITPTGGFAGPATPTFTYRDWDNIPWAATSSGAWLVQTKSGTSTLTPSFRFKNWNGNNYFGSRIGPNFLITKQNPASSDINCPANALTGYSAPANISACRTLVLPYLELKDSSGANVTVRMAEAPEFTSLDHTAFTMGVSRSFTISTSGAPAPTLSFSGSLPSGITFTPAGPGTAQLVFNGTGTTGTFPITLQAQNAQGTATQNFTLIVGSTLTITSAPKASFKAYEFGSFTFTTTGSTPVNFTIEAPVPPGLTFTNNNDGTATLSGITTGGGGSCFNVNRPCGLIASNAVSTAYQNFSIEVLQQPVITFSPATVTFNAGSPNLAILRASHNKPAVKFSLPCTNPSWLSITDNGDGTAFLTGTPPAGTTAPSPIHVAVNYTANTAAIPQCFFVSGGGGPIPGGGQTLVPNNNFTINILPDPQFTSESTIFGLTGTQNAFTITTNQSAGVITAAGPLVPGITFRDNGNGTADLSGSPQAGYGGFYPLNLSINNNGEQGGQILNWHMLEAPSILGQDAVLFHTGMNNALYINTVGYPRTPVADIPSQWGAGMRFTSTGPLPPGVTFNSKTPSGLNSGVGLLSGNPSPGSEGTYMLTLTAINGAPPTATKPFTLIVAKMGDVNSDTTVDCTDVSVVRAALNTRRGFANYVFRADINNDGVVDLKDIALVSSRLPSGTRCQ